jgi:NAD(P)-dependent dehydrogenase (short-subunit alcohol dehydrogenase family)
MAGVLDGKIAIVTGASRGCGRGEALALAKEGANVALLARGYDAVVETAEEVGRLGVDVLPLQCDVAQVDQVKRSVQAVIDRWGVIDILVNNAQVLYHPHPFETWTEEEMRASWESGVLGTWAFMIECFPHMKERGGRIVNTCSPTGHGPPSALLSGYAAAKEGIRALTRTAAREWGRYRINVNAVSPMALTESVRGVFPTEEDQLDVLRSGGPTLIHRWGDPEHDIGRAVVYLVGPDSEIVTGCLLPVDSGSAI